MPLPYAAPSAGSIALAATKGSHPTTRFDAFLRSTDPIYQHAEASRAGDRFIRQMSTYGLVRPSASFVSESRMHRPFNPDNILDMSRLPAPWYDPSGDPKEGTLVVPAPPKGGMNMEFVDMYKNDALMLPSERREEARRIIAGEKKWREDRKAHFGYKKAIRTLEMKYPDGVLGVDGPMCPETRIWADRREQLLQVKQRRQSHAERRFPFLEEQMAADDATALRHWGSEPNLHRSQDIGIARKSVERETHPQRFLDTHSRLFPKYTAVWDPERAASLRSHDTRDKRYDIISGADNAISFEVARNWGLPDPAQVTAQP
jgi:hypothetical protein